jgi:hypothetical protein
VKQGGLCRKTAKRRGNGVEFDLLDLEVVAVLVNHVVGPEETKGKILRGGSSATRAAG